MNLPRPKGRRWSFTIESLRESNGAMSNERNEIGVIRAIRGSRLCLLAAVLAFCATAISAGAIQFDVFLGFDGIVPESSWFPIVCEVKNDGPAFSGTIEVTSGSQDQPRRMVVELPTGTLKRLVIPIFSASRGSGHGLGCAAF